MMIKELPVGVLHRTRVDVYDRVGLGVYLKGRDGKVRYAVTRYDARGEDVIYKLLEEEVRKTR